MSETSTNLDSLIPFLRLRIGDTNALQYRYTDEWLSTSIVSAINFLGPWWRFKYLLDSNYDTYRNPNYSFYFDQATYGLLEPGDDQIIITAAALIILEGSLENSAWDFVSWSDAEIRYSNLEQSRAKDRNVQRLWEQLTNMLKPPQKRLGWLRKGSLPGYLNNEYERKVDDSG